MENFIKIIYSRAHDGFTNKKGKPTSLAHFAIILVMSDADAPGILSLLSTIIRTVAKRAKKTESKNGYLKTIAVWALKF